MTVAEIEAVIQKALGDVAYDEVGLLSYCLDVRTALRAALPKEAVVDSFHRIREFVVQVRLDGRLVQVVTPLPESDFTR